MRRARRKAIVVAAACGALALVATRPAAALDTIKINYVEPATYYDPLFLAIDKGYFAEEGIAAEVIQAGGGVATPALIAGDLDFSTSGSVAISAILKGAKLKVLFVTSDTPAFELWAQPAIKSLDDLKGQQVGIITRGDTSEIALRYYLTTQSKPADFIAYTPLGTGTARVAGIASGTYSAVLLGLSELELLKATAQFGRLHRLADLTKDVHMVFSGLATSDAVIAKQPDLVHRVLRAWVKGMRLAKASRADALAAQVAHGAGDTQKAASTYDATAALLSDTGTASDADVKLELQLRADLLGIPKDQVKPPRDIFDFRFVKEAATELDNEHWKPKVGGS